MARDANAIMSESSLQAKVLRPATQISNIGYVPTFGKHKGYKLSQIPTSCLR